MIILKKGIIKLINLKIEFIIIHLLKILNMDNKLVLFIASKQQLVIKGDCNNSFAILNRVIDEVIKSEFKSENEREKIWNRIVKEWDTGRACY